MVFTERQKNELKVLTSELAREIVNNTLNDKKFIDTLVDKISDQVSERISDTLKHLSTKVSSLESKIKELQTTNDDMKSKIDEMEQRSKLFQLRIYGLHEKKNKNDIEDLNLLVTQMFQSKLDLKDINLVNCYRVGPALNNKDRATVVTFDSLKQRNIVFLNKKRLKGSKMIIVEELTRSRYELMSLAREKLGKNMVWSSNGKIFTRVDDKKICIKSEDDVANIHDNLEPR